jgi:biotin transport system substrate-specific component
MKDLAPADAKTTDGARRQSEEESDEKKRGYAPMTSRDMSLVGLFAALTAVCAQVSVTLPFLTGVPFTLQVFAVLASGAILGARRGFLSQLVYLMLGAVGVPVFAHMAGGFQILMGPTGGYLWAFPLAAFVTGWAADWPPRRGGAGGLAYLYLGMLGGIALIYGLGAAGLIITGVAHTVPRALQLGVLPFIWWDLLKGYLAAFIAVRVRSAVAPERKVVPLV